MKNTASQRASSPATDSDVLVLGGGAAGLMCAAVAAQRGRSVRVLEKTKRCGKKILMSGGGRCNFTNLHTSPANFLSANPHYCKSALARYTPADFIALVDAYGIAYHEKERGQLFCDDSAKAIVSMLLSECSSAGVTIETRVAIQSVARKATGGFRVVTDAGDYTGQSVVVATGGLPIPKMGASDFGLSIARDFGLPVQATRAALVPFTLDQQRDAGYDALSGLAANVEARCNDAVFDAGLLFTHRGLSGPAMLQISSYWQPGDVVAIDWLPGPDIEDWLSERAAERPNARLSSVLAERLPKRLAQRLCHDITAHTRLSDVRLKQLDGPRRAEWAKRLGDWQVTPGGTEGYKTAEVMYGGVDTRCLDSTTMAARDVPGLYFIGEVVDVTGHLGGHNFQWAWASAHAAGTVA
ncbi:NAD(P)/FAD-dependent oxidoreductase [uncultured Salinisphaera sp.]|uniref:NAD(P)/FAD-dependent oxidoreductase n=1 Tax=uncultured Salinisphaera sp. TaxID=359372 RepID=UPI0032B0F56B|tara:strand:+ start:7350 stop:8582 length:1233 start_codon:yes stop_codon:yes gene_type:complete